MKNKFRLTPLIMAAVVFLSSVGHVFVIHICAMEQSACAEKTSCCCENEKEKPCKEGALATSNNCCFNTLNYLINPFSVQKPENQVKKINIVACEIKLFYAAFKINTGAATIKHLFTDDASPPGNADLLTMISTFQI